jgi:hypothetical protein
VRESGFTQQHSKGSSTKQVSLELCRATVRLVHSCTHSTEAVPGMQEGQDRLGDDSSCGVEVADWQEKGQLSAAQGGNMD